MPSFPHDGFAKLEDAREWVHAFVSYYNNEHHHIGLKFLTPNERHNGECENILNRRKDVLKAAKAKHPERWTGSIQDCTIDDVVWLNPSKEKSKLKIC